MGFSNTHGNERPEVIALRRWAAEYRDRVRNRPWTNERRAAKAQSSARQKADRIETANARRRNWAKDDPRNIERRAQWRQSGGAAKADRRYREKNREAVNRRGVARTLARRKSDPVCRMLHRLRNRLFIAVKQCAGLKSSSQQKDLFGCSSAELRAHIEKQFSHGMTWKNYGEWHVDHKRPCASFNLTDRVQQHACFHFSNLQPLWGPENLSKGDQWDGQSVMPL